MPDQAALEKLQDPRWAGRIFIVSGPSGVGKSVLVRRVIEQHPDIQRVITATTRQPGPKERDGIDYHFVSVPEFRRWIETGQLLEHVEFCDNYYGTPVWAVTGPLEEGRAVVLVIDVKGALKVMEMIPSAVSIFIAPPSLHELRRRIEGRGRDEPEAIGRRLQRAREELTFKDRYDHVVINDDLDEAALELRRLITAHIRGG